MHVSDEDVLWSRDDLISELETLQYKIKEAEGQVKSAFDAMTEIQKSLLESGILSDRHATCEAVLNDLSKTITSLTKFQSELRADYLDLLNMGLTIDPLFLCTR